MIAIKKPTLRNADIIAKIAKQSFIESHGHSASVADIDSYVSITYTIEAIKKELADKENIIYLINHNEMPAGYSKIILNAPVENVKANNITKLDRLYLLQEFYGLKLGSELLEFNINMSKNAKQAGMWLYTWIENKRAISFYVKHGFKVIGKADFRISEDHSNPNHLMYLNY